MQADGKPTIVVLAVPYAAQRSTVQEVRAELAGRQDPHRRQASGPCALLLPLDPDASCRRLRDAIGRRAGVAPAVLIIDSLGRAWRTGTCGTAIGVAGLSGLLDLHGRRLETSKLCLADEIVAASLAMGQAGEGRPVAIVRGVPYARDAGQRAPRSRRALWPADDVRGRRHGERHDR